MEARGLRDLHRQPMRAGQVPDIDDRPAQARRAHVDGHDRVARAQVYRRRKACHHNIDARQEPLCQGQQRPHAISYILQKEFAYLSRLRLA